MELWPLAELELFLLRPLRSRARCMLMKVGMFPGENMFDHMPGEFPAGGPPNGRLFTACGVINIGSSGSSGSIGSPSSDELLEASEPSMLMLPTELDGATLSPCPHICRPTLGESITIEFPRGLREGIIMPFCVIVGEESGEDCSARVEWWRLVQALENSAPRDRRGRRAAGAAYVLRESNCGESGTRAAKCAGLGIGISRGGICRERPLERSSGRRGVRGLARIVWSSLDAPTGSRNLGDGSRWGALSDSERALGDLVFCGVLTGARPVVASLRSSAASCLLSPASVGVIATFDFSWRFWPGV